MLLEFNPRVAHAADASPLLALAALTESMTKLHPTILAPCTPTVGGKKTPPPLYRAKTHYKEIH